MNEVNVFNQNSLNDWNDQIYNELVRREKITTRALRLFRLMVVAGLISIAGVPFLLIGFLGEKGKEIAILWLPIWVFIVLITNRFFYKEYLYKKREFERLQARANLRPDTKNALRRKKR